MARKTAAVERASYLWLTSTIGLEVSARCPTNSPEMHLRDARMRGLIEAVTLLIVAVAKWISCPRLGRALHSAYEALEASEH